MKKIDSDCYRIPVTQGRKCVWLIGKHLIPLFFGQIWDWFNKGQRQNSTTSLWGKEFYFSGKGVIKGKAGKQSVFFILR